MRVTDDGSGGWSMTVPEPGSVDAGACVSTVDELSDEALVAARSRLNPVAGAMLSAVWAPDTGQLALMIHHLVVDGVSWRILLEDLNIAWAQHHGGQPVALPSGGTSFARWSSLLAEHARSAEVVGAAQAWRQVAATPAALPSPRPELDTYASAGALSVSLGVEPTRLLLGEVPAAFHAGVQDILLIALGLACAEFLPNTGVPIGVDVEGHGRFEELAADVDLSRTVGWFTTKYPVSLTMNRLSWADVKAGEAALGPVIKNAKEQLRALPDGVTYGLLRYLNPEVELAGSDPTIGFNYLGRLGAATAEASDELWRVSATGVTVAGVAAAIFMPLAHTVALNAATADTDTGPSLQANWTWAASALDGAQVQRLSQLWFEALEGICAHVQHGGGGLTPSDIAPARLSQSQLDELQRQDQIADVLPLTPVQQGLLFHSSFAQDTAEDLYAVQLGLTVTGPLDPQRLRDAVHSVVARHPGGPLLRPVQRARADHPRRSRTGVAVPGAGRRRRGRRARRATMRCRARRGLRRRRRGDLPRRVDPHVRQSAPIRVDDPSHRDRWLVAADSDAGDLRRLLRRALARRGALSQLCQLASQPRSRRGACSLGGSVRWFRYPHPRRSAGPGEPAKRRNLLDVR
jgi:non-ribosomal peptide synthase protein (TIGR01720 family)